MARELGSIRQNQMPAALPDLCTPGNALRSVVAVNLLALLGLLVRDHAFSGLLDQMLYLSAWIEPILLVSMLAVCSARPWLNRLHFRLGLVAAILLCTVSARLMAVLIGGLLGEEEYGWQASLWAAMVAGLVLYWLALLQQARSPALAEARLMALTARIRPHFLFNSLNAILGVIRAEPRRAEAALEELADLFRVLMQDPRDLVLLSEEIALSRRYLELERLRLGERLQVQWDIESCPPDALMPPLMLQPLLENAVYHGIEPCGTPGMIHIRLARIDRQVLIELSNPLQPGHVHGKGNQMALANIRERLLLFFDFEASLVTEVGQNSYTVRIRFPYRNNP